MFGYGLFHKITVSNDSAGIDRFRYYRPKIEQNHMGRNFDLNLLFCILREAAREPKLYDVFNFFVSSWKSSRY